MSRNFKSSRMPETSRYSHITKGSKVNKDEM
jgi:hypothetical protein